MVSGHFSRFVPENTHTDWLQTAIKHMFEQHQGRQLMVHIGTCGGEIEKKVASLVGSNDSPHILSEAELRYAVGDPLLDMLVTCWGFRVTLLLYCNLCKGYCTQFPNRLSLKSGWTLSTQWKRALPDRVSRPQPKQVDG